MRRRISLTMVLMVIGALVFAGLATLGLTVLESVNQTRQALVSEASGLAKGINDELKAVGGNNSLTVLRSTLDVLKGPLQLQGEAVLAVRRDGTFYNPLAPAQTDVLPGGLQASQIYDNAFISAYAVSSGHNGRMAWAAKLVRSPVQVGPSKPGCPSCGYVNLVVVLTRQAPVGVGSAWTWFGLASLATVVVALLAANRLGHRIARPLRQTEAVTGRIAAGDLDARVVLAGHDGPELWSLANSVNSMAAALARAQRTQRQFLMSVSHDLRTPLTSVQGYAEALYDGATDDVHHASGVILSEARRLERLVADLLDLAKLEAGAFSLQCEGVDLRRAALDAVQAFQPAAQALGIDLAMAEGADAPTEQAAPAEGPRCYADPDRLGQVVANLVENALKYAGSTVTVDVCVREGRPTLSVDDDGPGIPPEDLDKVFTRLYQSASAASRKLGSGLGLAIVEELVTAMGGRAWAVSPRDAGGGTRISVELQADPRPRSATERDAQGLGPGSRSRSGVGRQVRPRPATA